MIKQQQQTDYICGLRGVLRNSTFLNDTYLYLVSLCRTGPEACRVFVQPHHWAGADKSSGEGPDESRTPGRFSLTGQISWPTSRLRITSLWFSPTLGEQRPSGSAVLGEQRPGGSALL